MRGSVLLIAAWMVGCGGEPEDTDEPVVDTGPEAIGPTEFATGGSSTLVEVELDEDWLASSRAANALVAGVGVVVADTEVQNRLTIDNGDNDEARAGARAYQGICWERPFPARSEFLMNFDPCSLSYGMRGGVYVDDHPSGPVLFEFLNFAAGEREITGVFGLDRLPEIPLAWEGFETDSFSPSTENRVPIGVNVDGVTYGLSFLGGNAINFGLGQEWSWWGELNIQGPNATHQVLYGGTDASELEPRVPAGIPSAKTTLRWSSCRCAEKGTVHWPEVEVAITRLTVDLDDLKLEDDGFDDPALDLDVDAIAVGSLAVNPQGCGVNDFVYEATTPATYTLTGDMLVAQISSKCESLVISNEAHCAGLISAAQNAEDITITLDETQVQEAVLLQLGLHYDDEEFCSVLPSN